MESLKTGTVEIRQHVETTPTVSKNFVVGTILCAKHQMEQFQLYDRLDVIGTFIVIGHHNVFKFIGKKYLSVCAPSDFTAHSDEQVVDDPRVISYLRIRAQKYLGGLIQEIEEGVFDD
tara:strand:- start:386 stop:739 length:354 start_codon:yes stop_codon:yes gene_type:complete